MPRVSRLSKFLANPLQIGAWAKDNDGKRRLRVVMATARGARNEMAFDAVLGVFRLERVLPEGMSFPYDVGFVPSTRAEGGAPLRALVLMDEPAPAGTLVECQPIGVVLGERQGERHKSKKWIRDDRLVAVAIASLEHGGLKHIDDLDPGLLGALDKFFAATHAADETRFRLVGSRGPGKAWRFVERAARNWRKRSD